MDEETLKLLSELEDIYPNYKKFQPSPDMTRRLHYLFEKNIIHLKWHGTLGSNPYKAKITADGIDAINLLMNELREQNKFKPPATQEGKLQSVIKSPVYQEMKDWIITYFAKLTA